MKRPLRVRFIIDRKFQSEIVGYLLVIWLVSSLSMIYLVDSAMTTEFRNLTSDESLFNRDQIVALFELKSRIRTFGLAGVLVALLGSIVGGIMVSHRIAGPIFSLRRKMDTAASNGVYEKVTFRKSDFAANLAESYNRMIERVNSKS